MAIRHFEREYGQRATRWRPQVFRLAGGHEEGAQVVDAPVGSIAAYGSRPFHRGLGNTTDEGRPALIFCYDRTWSPPPGTGTAGSIANANLAHLLNIVSTGWNACSSWLRAG